MVQVRAPRKFLRRPSSGSGCYGPKESPRIPDKGSGLEGGVIPQNDKTCTIDLSQMQNVVSGKVLKKFIKKVGKQALIGA